MNKLQVFTFQAHEIRTVQQNGETWWVLKDVCGALGLSNPSIVAARLDDDERAKFDLGRSDATGGGGETNIINESGLYNVILRSDKPEAKSFKRWVTHEVLPTIRKHGLYAVDDLIANPDFAIRALEALKAERAKNAALSAQNEVLQFTAEKYEGQIDSVGLYKTGEIAKELGVSANQLNGFLLRCRVQYKPNGSNTWQLYTEHARDHIAVTRIVRLDNGREMPMLLWTPKGRDFIHDLCEKELPPWYA